MHESIALGLANIPRGRDLPQAAPYIGSFTGSAQKVTGTRSAPSDHPPRGEV
jgi:hypothetical protein